MDKVEVRELVRYLEEEHGVNVNSIDIKDNRCGKASYARGKIILPKWIFEDSVVEEYRYQYIIHEVAHLVVGPGHGHDQYFKEVESDMLSDFDITVKYAKAYVSELYVNGNLVCDCHGKPTKYSTKDFELGEIVEYHGNYYEVTRRNQKTVSIEREAGGFEYKINTEPSNLEKVNKQHI